MKSSTPSHVFVVFGATGDLARRKLLPAVCRLAHRGVLGGGQRVIGVARSTDHDDASFRALAREALLDAGLSDDELATWCDDCLYYQPLPGGADGYAALARRIEEVERANGLPGNRVFYLAVPPKAFPGTIEGLGAAGLNSSAGWTRIVVEKPFGEDLATARELNALMHERFEETQIYRIDHYLGKETVQNLLVFRFANMIFESLWNRDRIDNVQITVAEDLGVENRAGYYDGVGALRDMIQNHLTQVLTLVAMEVPGAYEADAVRHEKIKVLRAIRPIERSDVVFGQYVGGRIRDEDVAGYLEERGVPEGSSTETCVSLKVEIDNWRWQGIPFYLRSGKRLPRSVTEIAVTFRSPPVSLFESMEFADVGHDVLTIRLQPDEGFALSCDVKRPGSPLVLEKVPLEFRYGKAFGKLPDAYVTLLLDVLLGDQTLFVHADEVEEAWKLYEPLLDGSTRVRPYPAGTWGPRESEVLLARHGRVWRTV